jgi:hypothetical protein
LGITSHGVSFGEVVDATHDEHASEQDSGNQ